MAGRVTVMGSSPIDTSQQYGKPESALRREEGIVLRGLSVGLDGVADSREADSSPTE